MDLQPCVTRHHQSRAAAGWKIPQEGGQTRVGIWEGSLEEERVAGLWGLLPVHPGPPGGW